MVKYNQYLESHKLQQWKFQYINYYQLKTYLKDNHITNFDENLSRELSKVDHFYNQMLGNLENITSLDDCYNEADKLRQYVLLNIVGFIKIIKKRNKNVKNDHSLLDAKEKLTPFSFYQCHGLEQKFKVLFDQAYEENTQLLQRHFESSNSFRILLGYHRFQPSFKHYTDLPFCNKEFVEKYLSDPRVIPENSTAINQVLEIEQNRETEPTLEDIPPPEVSTRLRYQRYFMLLLSLYCFLFGLGLMGDSFKAMSGKSMGSFFSSISNPIAGVMIGIIATVLLQSSSTTTSIVVSMVGADLVTVKEAIPVIMGANIGTSVTNTIVSQGHIRNLDEFKRAFAGATVHDLFNLLSVLILLPFNLITSALGYPFFEKFTSMVTSLFADIEAGTFKSPIKIIVSPLTKLFLKVNKDVIKAHAKGCVSCQPDLPDQTDSNNQTSVTTDDGSEYCYDIEGDSCVSHYEWEQELEDSDVIKSGLFKELGSVVSLLFSLVVLCLAVYFLIKNLQRVVIGGGSQSWVIRTLHKIMNKSPYLSMLFGIGLTIMVQSSSITTSTFTPLVGLDIISLEQMLPLTLGANIGTTCTAFLAALVSGKVNAIQIALCHFFFNIFGILIWFPNSRLRKIPLEGAKYLGDYITRYKWFGFFYLCYVFVLTPLLLLLVSFLFDYANTFASILAVVLIGLIISGSVALFCYFDQVLKKLEQCLRP